MPSASACNHRGNTAPGEGDFKLGFTGHQFDPETGLVYARARYYDPELGRFLSRDSYEGQLADAPSLHRYAYAHGNPTYYRDYDGHSATAVGTALGFAWGVGQAIGAGVNDLFWRQSRGLAGYASIVAQNAIGGAELGASIDVAVLSGGTLTFAGSGALGGAGFEAMSLDGRGKSWSDFGEGQVHGLGYGAVGGAVLGKLAPVLARIPGVKEVVEKVSEAGTALVSRYAPTATESLLTGGANPFARLAGGTPGEAGGAAGKLAREVLEAEAPDGAHAAATAGRGEAVETGQYLFRGTSEGYAGNPGLQRIGITPATTDPSVATMFAVESANYGTPVVQVASPANLAGVEISAGNTLAALEREVGVGVLPIEFAKRAGNVLPAERSRAILRELGVDVPGRIPDKAALDRALRNIPKMTEDQIRAYLDRLIKEGGRQ